MSCESSLNPTQGKEAFPRPGVDAYIASIAIRIMSDMRDEEKDRNKDQRSKVCCKTLKIQEITVRYINDFNSLSC